MRNTAQLDKFKFGVIQYLTEAGLDAYIDDVRVSVDELCVAVKGHVYGERHEENNIEYPADWWQAFKQRFFPSWLLARYPVKMTTITPIMIYPKINVSFPEAPRYVILQKRETEQYPVKKSYSGG